MLFSSLLIVLHAVESFLLLLKDCEKNCRRLCREVGGTYFYGGGGCNRGRVGAQETINHCGLTLHSIMIELGSSYHQKVPTSQFHPRLNRKMQRFLSRFLQYGSAA